MHHQAHRQDLAAALRWAVRMGWQSGICNHFSLAVDQDGEAPAGILINPQGYHWSELTASSLLLMDYQGEVIEGDGKVEPTAFFIHMAIHSRVPTAKCVLHAHPPYSTAIMCTEGGRLVNCNQDSLRFHNRIAYDDDFGGVANDSEEGNRIAGALGNKQIMLMAHHGITVTGATTAKALDDFYYLEVAAKSQILAQSTGMALKVMDDATADRLAPPIQAEEEQMIGHFASIRRILDREEPEYRT
ncbi:MAG: aldolase [Rhodospirillales bacterium]|nr:aldolase [Rhodospirillales bacterium]